MESPKVLEVFRIDPEGRVCCSKHYREIYEAREIKLSVFEHAGRKTCFYCARLGRGMP